MKTVIAGFMCFSVLALLSVHPTTVEAQTQQEMNRHAARDFAAADVDLNKVYKQLAGRLDEESQAKLKAVQRAWVQFRDAEAEFEADVEARGGTMAPVIYNGRRAELTKIRTEELGRVFKEYGR
jgi:uncharacterized protein YecT (DUF1311 family)